MLIELRLRAVASLGDKKKCKGKDDKSISVILYNM